MAYTDDDLRKMLTDCIAEVHSLGYELHPILSIKFTPGSQICPGYLRHDAFSGSGPYNPFGVNAFHIRIHGALKEFGRSAANYNDLKTVVMQEVMHAIFLPETEKRLCCSYLPRCDEYCQIQNEVQAAFGCGRLRKSGAEEGDAISAFLLKQVLNRPGKLNEECINPDAVYSGADLEEMLKDCIAEIERLGYSVYPIRGIHFWKGTRYTMGRIICPEMPEYDKNSGLFRGVEALIEIHRIFTDLRREDYMALKALVMHEVIHAIRMPKKLRGQSVLRNPFVSHGLLYEKIKKEVETAYGYRCIYPHEEPNDSRLENVFKVYCENETKRRSAG